MHFPTCSYYSIRVQTIAFALNIVVEWCSSNVQYSISSRQRFESPFGHITCSLHKGLLVAVRCLQVRRRAWEAPEPGAAPGTLPGFAKVSWG